MNKLKTNVFYHGDCLFVMKHDIPTESIDLIYLDPPFFTGRVQKGKWEPGDMQISYDDSKKFWSNKEIQENAPNWLKEFALRDPKSHWHPFARYLYYMYERLQECKNVLKSDGSIYLHCDWRASHYLRIIMDEIFGYKNFKNDISWLRTSDVGYYKSNANFFAHNQDNILFYTKTNNYFFNNTLKPFSKEHKIKFNQNDNDGKGYYYWENLSFDSEKGIETIRKPKDELKQRKSGKWSYKRYLLSLKGNGTNYHDIWVDICRVKKPLYPTQKPETLLERIIKASSEPEDIILDPFCGCGTTIIEAHKLGRRWIGIDSNGQAIVVIKQRISKMGLTQGNLDLKVEHPSFEISHETLMKMNGKEFERWVNRICNAKSPVNDSGVDGIMVDGTPIQTKTYKVSYDIVGRLLGDAEAHPEVPKPLKKIRVVSREGFDESAWQRAEWIKHNKEVEVELKTPEDLIKIK